MRTCRRQEKGMLLKSSSCPPDVICTAASVKHCLIVGSQFRRYINGNKFKQTNNTYNVCTALVFGVHHLQCGTTPLVTECLQCLQLPETLSI